MPVLLLFSLGIALLAIVAAQTQRWSGRIAILTVYAMCGGFLGEILQRLEDRRIAGSPARSW